MAAIPVAAFAIGGPSGPKIDYHVQGHLGEVMMNPYGIAPLTAIVRDGGYTVKDVTVRVLPKPDGREIKYKVSDRQVLPHGGIPVFGLYPDYVNKVEVSYTRELRGKTEKFTDTIQLYAPPVYFEVAGITMEKEIPYGVEVKKVAPPSNGTSGRRTRFSTRPVTSAGTCLRTRSTTSTRSTARA